MVKIVFKGKRIDNDEWVYGHYFVAPLTDENSGTDPDAGWFFLNGEERHCISGDEGVVYVVHKDSVDTVESNNNMRTIIFRGRSKETGEWVEGNYTHNKRKGEFHSITDFDHNISHMIYRESLQMKNYNNEFEDV